MYPALLDHGHIPHIVGHDRLEALRLIEATAAAFIHLSVVLLDSRTAMPLAIFTRQYDNLRWLQATSIDSQEFFRFEL